VLSAYGVGVCASRTSTLTCARHLACMALVAQARPDCRTIRALRTVHVEACQDVLVPGVRVAGEAGLGQVGTGSPDGTTIQGHASRHQARRDG